MSTATQQEKISPTQRLTRWAFARHGDESSVKAAARSTLRILIIMIQEFISTNITLRASALTFTIILSLVPLLAMSTAILKGLGSGDQLQTVAYRFIDQLDPQDHPADTTDSQNSNALESIDFKKAAPSLNSHLHNTADTIFKYVDNTNFAALGAFGIVGLLIAVILVFSSMEDAMNSIWHTSRGRSLFRKMMDYLALLILLPISVNIAIAGDAVLESPKMMGYINTIIPSDWVVQMLFTLLPFFFITMSLLMMYLFFPHVKVKTIPALCGAVFAAVFWFIVQRGYIVLQIGVAKYNAIYGSFATVPLLLVWMQLGWTFILLGAVLAYAIQNRNNYQLPGNKGKPQIALQRAFDVLLEVYSNFIHARPTSTVQLLTTLPGENEADINLTVNLLIQGGLLFKSEDNCADIFFPSRPAEQLSAREVIRLVLGDDQVQSTAGGELAMQVIQAAEQTAAVAAFPGSFLQRRQEALEGES